MHAGSKGEAQDGCPPTGDTSSNGSADENRPAVAVNNCQDLPATAAASKLAISELTLSSAADGPQAAVSASRGPMQAAWAVPQSAPATPRQPLTPQACTGLGTRCGPEAAACAGEAPKAARQRLVLARLLLARGRAAEALAHLDAGRAGALGASTPDADAACLRGRCLAALGNNAEARARPHSSTSLCASASACPVCRQLS